MTTRLLTVIDDMELLARVCGPNDVNLKEISTVLNTRVFPNGNEIVLETDDPDIQNCFDFILSQLMEYSRGNRYPDRYVIRTLYEAYFKKGGTDSFDIRENQPLRVFNREIVPRNSRQGEYLKGMANHDIVFSLGPAGTGKTYLAIAAALSEILNKKKRKLILTRPVVEAGESLGFLPGDLADKLAPYLRPLYDAIEDLLPIEILNRLRDNNIIEVAPLAYMRGRTLKDCFIVLDEAQNTTVKQMKMFLTRIGEGSRAVITGDPTQIDLPDTKLSGLLDAERRLKPINDIFFISFSSSDVVRHRLVQKIIDAYEK